MNKTKILLIVGISFLFVTCGNKENKTKKITHKKLEVYISPCEFISTEDVKRVFTVESVAIIMENLVLTHPTCIFKWEDSKVFYQKYIGNVEVKTNLPSELLIVLVKDTSDKEFKSIVKVYKNAQKINNIGEMAMWDKKMLQLSFLFKNHLFHIHVKASNDEEINKEKAIEVSKLILGKF